VGQLGLEVILLSRNLFVPLFPSEILSPYFLLLPRFSGSTSEKQCIFLLDVMRSSAGRLW
jgi:hypothetical protein